MGTRIQSKNARSLSGYLINSTPPTDGQALLYDLASNSYIPTTIPSYALVSGNGTTFSTDRYNLGGTLTAPAIITDSRGTPTGIEYGGDYSATYTARSLVDYAYVNSVVASAKAYQGGYNPVTNSPDLTTPIAGIEPGDVWDVTADGTFLGEIVEVGDTLTSKVASPTLITDWVIGQTNLTAASVKVMYESNADTNAYTDAAKTKVDYISVTAAINLDSISNGKLAPMAAYTIKGNGTNGAATPTDIAFGDLPSNLPKSGDKAFGWTSAGVLSEFVMAKLLNTMSLGTTTSGASTPDISSSSCYYLTAQAQPIVLNAPIGTPDNTQELEFRFRDDGTARAITWNAIYTSPTGASLPTTTVVGETMYLRFLYNSTTAKWEMTYSSEGTGGGGGSDTDAIHKNVANEITAIADKATPALADEFILEDSADSFDKKSMTWQNLTKLRVATNTSWPSAQPNVDVTDQFQFTALSQATSFQAPTGTPLNGQRLMVRLKDNGTARAITWNAIYVADSGTLPSTTVVGETTYIGFAYNSATVKWEMIYNSDVSGGGGGASPLTTKGDLYTYDTGDQRLAVGGNGDSLVADSTEATGLKWKKNNTSGTVAPTVTDDSASGYEVGSMWIDVTNNIAYICVDATASAAIWITAGSTSGLRKSEHTITGWQSAYYTESFAHGFGSKPDWVHVVAVCKVADQGYAIGDEVDLKNAQSYVSAGEIGFNLKFDTSNVEYIGTNNANPLRIWTQDSGDAYTISDTNWDVKITAYKGGANITTDSDAIHDNVDGEIAAIAAKATPVNADLLLIEDSAASNAKKKVTFENLKNTINASGKPTLSKTITIEEPTASEDLTIFYTDVAITVQEIRAVSTGTTPSTTYQIKTSSLDRGGAGTNVTTSAATTSTSLGDTASITTAAVPSGSWVWLESTAASGTNVTLSINIRYTED